MRVVEDILLRRRGLVFIEPTSAPSPATSTTSNSNLARAAALEMAAVGVVPSTRLEAALARLAPPDLLTVVNDVIQGVLQQRGGDVRHTPLFRRFPDDVPADTTALWWQKVLVHFLQAEGGACLFCGATSTTHVLSPCSHVVCDACFDGTTYSACPVCEHHVDRTSSFFKDAPSRGVPVEKVRLRRLDLGVSLDDELKTLFGSFCARSQALSPADKDDLTAIVTMSGARILSWLPPKIPVKENIALIFGTLFSSLGGDVVLPAARPYLATATDVLRLLAVMSGADASLQGTTLHKTLDIAEPETQRRFWTVVAKTLGLKTRPTTTHRVIVPVVVKRWKMVKLPRALRRALLSLLEGMPEDRLVEDVLRHRSYWVWVGEFLHPHEYADRFPKVARAFQVVRKKAKDGTKAPKPQTFASRAEDAIGRRDLRALTQILETRPGEFARRFDHALRLCSDDEERRLVLDGLLRHMDVLPTPLLLSLRSSLSTRTAPLPIRLFFPKGQVGKSVSLPDRRPLLTADVIRPAVDAFDAALLKRFAQKPALSRAVIDDEIDDIIVPFNERTASRAAVALPRGSHVDVPIGKVLRLFLHWCQPPGGETTDIDLSVSFYDQAWKNVGVCSFSQHRHTVGATVIAQSSGDLRDAPPPDGASEFVDVHVEEAIAAGHRYAVMIVNSFAGLPFSQLERGFAGLMLRDDVMGTHFDPRTVALRFALSGDNGVFLPVVVDLQTRRLHWLDVYAKGEFLFNTAKTSNRAIQRIGPEMIASFSSGVRATMHQLALLHAAARCRRVELRGRDSRVSVFTRKNDESALAFLARIRDRREVDGDTADTTDPAPIFAALLHGDLDVAAGSVVWALFHDATAGSIAASDLLS